jgi:hypothetical protein
MAFSSNAGSNTYATGTEIQDGHLNACVLRSSVPIQCALSRLTNRVWARHATDSRHRKQCMLLPNRRQMMKLKTSWTKRPELQDSSTQLRIGARYALNCLCPGVVARGWESRLMLCGLAAGDFHPVG